MVKLEPGSRQTPYLLYNHSVPLLYYFKLLNLQVICYRTVNNLYAFIFSLPIEDGIPLLEDYYYFTIFFLGYSLSLISLRHSWYFFLRQLQAQHSAWDPVRKAGQTLSTFGPCSWKNHQWYMSGNFQVCHSLEDHLVFIGSWKLGTREKWVPDCCP